MQDSTHILVGLHINIVLQKIYGGSKSEPKRFVLDRPVHVGQFWSGSVQRRLCTNYQERYVANCVPLYPSQQLTDGFTIFFYYLPQIRYISLVGRHSGTFFRKCTLILTKVQPIRNSFAQNHSCLLYTSPSPRD